MPWAKIDDNIFFNPKVFVISPEAKLLYIGGIVYASRFMTDGQITDADLPKLARMTGMQSNSILVSELVSSELWHETADGYQINDYLEYNPSREHVESVREKRREAGRKGGRPTQKQIGKQIGKQGGDSYIQDTTPVKDDKSISQNPFANQIANQIALPQDTEAAAALQAVEDAFGKLRLPQQQLTMDDILATFDEFRAAGRADWWKAAIDESLKYGGSSWSYMAKVLDTSKGKGQKPGYVNGAGSKSKGKGKQREHVPNDYESLKARYVPTDLEDIIEH